MSDLVSKKILLSAKGFTKNKNTAFYKKVVAALAVDVTQAATTTLRIKLKYTTVRHAAMRFAAHVEGSDVQSTANEKGIITMKFNKGGRHDIEIPIEGGEPIKLTSILLVKGRSKTITIEL